MRNGLKLERLLLGYLTGQRNGDYRAIVRQPCYLRFEIGSDGYGRWLYLSIRIKPVYLAMSCLLALMIRETLQSAWKELSLWPKPL
jgi:hypothetical protein